MRWYRVIRDFFFPPYCPSCGRLLNFCGDWCEECLARLCKPRKIDVSEFDYIDECYVLGIYDEGLKKIIQDVKFNDKKGAVEKLAPFFDAFNKKYSLESYDVVVPVPINKKKLKKRHYNQVDVLFKKQFKKKLYNWQDILAKSDDTKPMYDLTKEERLENIKNAYYIKKSEDIALIKDKNVLIVDDIFTTGSTMEVVSKVLKEKGAKKITALTLASGAVGLV